MAGTQPSYLGSRRNFRLLTVDTFHFAFSPGGVSSAFHVRNVMAPLTDPQARMGTRDVSRSWNAKERMGSSAESLNEVIWWPLIV